MGSDGNRDPWLARADVAHVTKSRSRGLLSRQTYAAYGELGSGIRAGEAESAQQQRLSGPRAAGKCVTKGSKATRATASRGLGKEGALPRRFIWSREAQKRIPGQMFVLLYALGPIS